MFTYKVIVKSVSLLSKLHAFAAQLKLICKWLNCER